MKQHSTNYFDTFIEVAEDSKTKCSLIPESKEKKTIAQMQYELIANNPYKFTSDDVFFEVYAIRNNIKKADLKKAREDFFSKGQPCFRASPLTKSFGFGVHSNSEGKIALVGLETPTYKKLISDAKVKKLKAMKTKK